MSPVFTHIALHVCDVEACVRFYAEYCGLQTIECREPDHVYWLAEPGREKELVFVLLPEGEGRSQSKSDYSHLGFALSSRAEVDAIAQRAKVAGCLAWAPVDNPYPVGYFCGIQDPSGNIVEFSYGQPLGPGAVNGP